jgi:hypothetical protein
MRRATLKRIYWSIILAALISPVVASSVLAVECNGDTTSPLGPFHRVGCTSGLAGDVEGDTSIERLANVFGMIVSVILGFVGVVFMIMGLWAGYLWMTARGSSEKISQAQDMLRNAIIGVIIVLSIFAITRTVLSNVSGVVAPGGW